MKVVSETLPKPTPVMSTRKRTAMAPTCKLAAKANVVAVISKKPASWRLRLPSARSARRRYDEV